MVYCRDILFIFAICVVSSGNPVHKLVSNSSVQIVRPSDSDFVEVIRGGALATDLVIQLKHVKVPEEGYIVLTVGGQSIIMCPQSADNISDCPNGDNNLPNNSVMTFLGVELGPQRICVELFDWDRASLERQCSVLVGSDRFMGLQESREYFTSNVNEFNRDAGIKLFWDTLVLKSAHNQIFQVFPVVHVFLR
jgi:hypothetical protein